MSRKLGKSFRALVTNGQASSRSILDDSGYRQAASHPHGVEATGVKACANDEAPNGWIEARRGWRCRLAVCSRARSCEAPASPCPEHRKERETRAVRAPIQASELPITQPLATPLTFSSVRKLPRPSIPPRSVSSMPMSSCGKTTG